MVNRNNLYDVCVWYITADGNLRWLDGLFSEFSAQESCNKALELTTEFVRESWIEVTALNRMTGDKYSYVCPTSIRLIRELGGSNGA